MYKSLPERGTLKKAQWFRAGTLVSEGMNLIPALPLASCVARGKLFNFSTLVTFERRQ